MPRTGAPPTMGLIPTTGADVVCSASRIPGTARMVPTDTTGFDDPKKFPQVENDFWPNSTGRMIQMSSNFFNYWGSDDDAKATFVHEFSHSCDRTVKEFIKPYGKDGRHSCNELTRNRSAFVEGWAEFNEMLDFPSERRRIQAASPSLQRCRLTVTTELLNGGTSVARAIGSALSDA